MIIKPTIRMNVHLKTHPKGIESFVKQEIKYIKSQPKLEDGPKNALILGGAAGYGLATRVALAFGAGTETISVSRGGEPKGKRTGSAGYWAAKYFDKIANESGIKSHSFFADCFSHETRKMIADEIRTRFGKLDLLVYSIAAGVRVNPDTGEKVASSLKPIDKTIKTFTIDVSTKEKKELVVEPATQEEIDNTIYCMGGEDWKLWVDFLLEEDLLAENFKTITYTYIGGDVTKEIYREGTIGEAKKHLEATAKKLDTKLSEKLNGRAYVSASKAIVSKASVFIPSMVVYGSALFEASLNQGKHESVIEHKWRLFNDFVYGKKNNDSLIRLDSYELDQDIQKEVHTYMELFENDPVSFFKLSGANLFMKNFYKINGFEMDDIDYDQEVEIEKLL